jgi:hypothetical protein
VIAAPNPIAMFRRAAVKHTTHAWIRVIISAEDVLHDFVSGTILSGKD